MLKNNKKLNMMHFTKFSFFTAVVLFASMRTSAQLAIPNSNFETWGPVSWGDTLQNWTSTDEVVNASVPFTVELNQEPSGVSGTAAKIRTTLFGFGDEPIIGLLMNGTPNYSYLPGIGTAYVSGGGTPITENPVAVTGYYMCGGSYDGIIEVTTTKWNSGLQQRDTISTGNMILPMATNSWTNFTIPLVYQSTQLADTICILIYSSDPSMVPSSFALSNFVSVDEITLVPGEDVEVTSVDAPIGSSNVTSPQTITATIQNNGSTDLVNPDIYYTDGVNTVSEVYSGTISAGNSQQVSFTQLWTPTAAGSNEICVYIDQGVYDLNPANDTACVIFTSDIQDAEMSEIIAPAQNADVISSQDITIKVTNTGNVDVVNPLFGYSVDGNTPVEETYTGTIIPGDSVEYTFTQQWTPGAAGNFDIYAYVSIAGDVNSYNDTAWVNFSSSLDIYNEVQNNKIQIYPNPASNMLNIMVDQTLTFKLFDTQGRMVLIQEVNEDTQVDLNGIDNGVYVYHFECKNNELKYIGKLIVEK